MDWDKEVEKTEPLSGYSIFQAMFLFVAMFSILFSTVLTLYIFKSFTYYIIIQLSLMLLIQIIYVGFISDGKRPEQYYYSVEFPIKNFQMIFLVLQAFAISAVVIGITYFYAARELNSNFTTMFSVKSSKEKYSILIVYMTIYAISEEVFYRGFLLKSFPNSTYYHQVVAILYAWNAYYQCSLIYSLDISLILTFGFYFLHFYLDYIKKMNRLSGSILTQLLIKVSIGTGYMMYMNL